MGVESRPIELPLAAVVPQAISAEWASSWPT
jgi:hypothetical protein